MIGCVVIIPLVYFQFRTWLASPDLPTYMSKLVERVKATMGVRIFPATFCLSFSGCSRCNAQNSLLFLHPALESRDPFLRVSVSV